MKQVMKIIANRLNRTIGVAMGCFLMLASCRTGGGVVSIDAYRVPMDSVWEKVPDAEAVALLAPYKASMDSVMNEVKGEAAVSMDRFRPESPLSNLVADVLRLAAKDVMGCPADMGLVNIGGIRNVLTQGPVTTGNIYEILPFENSLCILTLKGTDLRVLLGNIAVRGGEGVSGITMAIDSTGQVLQAAIDGKPIEDERLYTVSTIDYLAEGNDGMTALTKAQSRICPEGATLRNLFMQYVEREQKAGRKLDAKIEGRIVIKEN